MHLDVIHCRHFVINSEHLVQCNKCVFSTDSNSCTRNFVMHFFRRVPRSDITLHSTCLFEEDSISETVVWPIFILIYIITFLKGIHF